MKQTRRPDWQERLTALVVARMTWPFVWGVNDCATFAAEAALQETGSQVLFVGVPAWGSARQAFRRLKEHGGLAAAVRESGLQEVLPGMARRGDLVLLRAPGRPGSLRGAIGVCMGERIAAPGARGLVMASLAEGVTAWRV
jgi:hypothetical protein